MEQRRTEAKTKAEGDQTSFSLEPHEGGDVTQSLINPWGRAAAWLGVGLIFQYCFLLVVLGLLIGVLYQFKDILSSFFLDAIGHAFMGLMMGACAFIASGDCPTILIWLFYGTIPMLHIIGGICVWRASLPVQWGNRKKVMIAERFVLILTYIITPLFLWLLYERTWMS